MYLVGKPLTPHTLNIVEKKIKRIARHNNRQFIYEKLEILFICFEFFNYFFSVNLIISYYWLAVFR